MQWRRISVDEVVDDACSVTLSHGMGIVGRGRKIVQPYDESEYENPHHYEYVAMADEKGGECAHVSVVAEDVQLFDDNSTHCHPEIISTVILNSFQDLSNAFTQRSATKLRRAQHDFVISG